MQIVGTTTHLRLTYEEPLSRRYHERLASFVRLVLLDERGAGMSDPIALSQLPTLEERMDDIRAVLDALEVEQVTLNGIGDGGPLTLLFVATYPERVDRLICYGTYARMTADPEYPIGIPSEVLEELISAIPDLWGTGWMVNILAPSVANGPFRERWARFESSSASPGQAQAIMRCMFLSDVRPALAAITAPTLVIHRNGDRKVPLR